MQAYKLKYSILMTSSFEINLFCDHHDTLPTYKYLPQVQGPPIDPLYVKVMQNLYLLFK